MMDDIFEHFPFGTQGINLYTAGLNEREVRADRPMNGARELMNELALGVAYA